MGANSDLERLERARRLASEVSGWRLVASRGYLLAAPPGFSRDWIIRHLPFQSRPSVGGEDRGIRVVSRAPTAPAAVTTFTRLALERYSQWDLSKEDQITSLDSVWKASRLLILSRTVTRLMGDENGTTLELSVYQKPISIGSRLGFALFPTMADPSRIIETTVYKAIDRDYSTRPPRTG